MISSVFRYSIAAAFVLAAVACELPWRECANAAVLPMNLNDLAAGSRIVVHGRVTSLESSWDENHRAIYSRVVVEPIEYLKGEAGDGPIVFDMPGGTVGDVRLVVSDMPEFEPGEEAILFLRDEYFRVVGMFQGKLTVRRGVVVERGVTLGEFRRLLSELEGGVQSEARSDIRGQTVIRSARFTLEPPQVSSAMSTGARVSEEELSPAGEVTIMTEDFESAWPDGDWDTIDQAGTGHLWGTDDYKPFSGSYSMWEASAGANAVDPEFNNYPNNMGTWARYGPFDLSDATSAGLSFLMSVNTAEVDDHLFWGSSGDGSVFDGYIASGGIGLWFPQIYDLSDHIGDPTVWIAFLFESDASVNDRGVFVDDIELVKTVVNPNPPQVTGVAPGTGPSGAAFPIAISGAYFGESRGSSEVRFTKDPVGGTFVYANVVESWSDTLVICDVPEGASSGPVNVVVSGDPGAGHDFTVTYGASSTWWQGSEPMGEDLKINPNTADVADELPAVIEALQEWNAGGGGAFSFTYAGPSSATTYSYNNVNEVCWGSTGGAVAATYTWFLGNSIMETDMVFDDLWSWSTSTPPAAGSFDVQAVAMHELGHWLRLLDLYGEADEGKTMYGRISFGEYGQRTLEPEDKGGMQHMYGAETVNITSRFLPHAETGLSYSATLMADGGVAPYSWELRLLSLPDGLTLSPEGVISGTPTTSGFYVFNVRVTDGDSEADSQILYITVDEGSTVDAPERPRRAETAVLWQNAPNPFSPRTDISFYLPEGSMVRLEVFDATGRLVDVLIPSRIYPAGVHTIEWDGHCSDGTPLGSGVYFCTLRTGDSIHTKKMVLAR